MSNVETIDPMSLPANGVRLPVDVVALDYFVDGVRATCLDDFIDRVVRALADMGECRADALRANGSFNFPDVIVQRDGDGWKGFCGRESMRMSGKHPMVGVLIPLRFWWSRLQVV